MHGSSKTQMLRILVVDDEEHIRTSLSIFLQSKGFEVDVACDGREAVSTISTQEYFLVFTDISMPGMDGLEALARIRTISPDTEVVMITANLELENAVLAMRCGAFDFITKPFYFDSIEATIGRVLAKHDHENEARRMEREKEKLIYEQKAALDTTLAFVRAVEEKDRYTKGHSERVARLSVKVAKLLNYTSQDLERIRYGSLLHDVGKIGVPRDILNKPGKLTKHEFQVIMKHPDVGVRILSPVTFLQDTLPIVLHHHENWDGTGYPHGLKEEDIPFDARIVRPCDFYDAVTSNRSYRRPMPPEAALQMISDGKGTLFDARIADVVMKVIQKDLARVSPPTPSPHPSP